MRYHYEKPDEYESIRGYVHVCDHPLYYRCTTYFIGGKGLSVIQQRFDPKRKSTYWTEIDPWLTDPIYLHEKFNQIFLQHARPPQNGIFPTITVRKLMWALRMKPLPKEPWETVFDRQMV